MLKALKSKNIACGYLYFYIHFITEIACFYFLTTITSGSHFVWLIPFIYDGLAFVPQAVIGYYSDKYPKINMGFIGTVLLVISYLMFIFLKLNILIPLVILCLGNAFIHISGAENTLKNSEGKLSHSAIFVGANPAGTGAGAFRNR